MIRICMYAAAIVILVWFAIYLSPAAEAKVWQAVDWVLPYAKDVRKGPASHKGAHGP